jgi:hypothetical protein|tara:strand:- start:283 stop:453 length:171 start_codon:yes stop_codon:yes gene_type:complete
MGIQKDMKKFYKDQPVAALVIGGTFLFGVFLPAFGYGYVGGKVADSVTGINGYQTW